MRKTLIALATAGSLLVLGGPALAATSYEPGIVWRTIYTPHFLVNYP